METSASFEARSAPLPYPTGSPAMIRTVIHGQEKELSGVPGKDPLEEWTA